jgi:SAM-dependent methyltransferase
MFANHPYALVAGFLDALSDKDTSERITTHHQAGRLLANSFWDREILDATHESWMAPPPCRFYINQRVSGDEHRWPIEWLRDRVGQRAFDTALSIGCGGGALEKSLLDLDICATIHAFDASVVSLAQASSEATRNGYASRVRYFAADFNTIVLPRARYDAVFFHQSLHHVARLERLLWQVWRTLKPGGTLYLDEYVGPSRFEWSEERMRPLRAIYSNISPAARKFEVLPQPIVPDDPTEAVRSNHIERYVRLGFNVQLDRPYGGAVLAPIFSNVNWPHTDPSVLTHLIALDKDMADQGVSFFKVMIATPKPFSFWAFLRYHADSRFRRIGTELRSIARRLYP